MCARLSLFLPVLALLLAALGLFAAAPAQAQTTSEVWSATLTVGGVANLPNGYIGAGSSVRPQAGAPAFGSLSDTTFILHNEDYTVHSIRWATEDATRSQVHLTLDRDFPDASLIALKLQIGKHVFALSDAVRGNRKGLANNYRWSQPAGWTDPARASTITVKILTLDPPAKPAGLTAAAGNARVALSWTDPKDSTITKYQYQWRKESGKWVTGTRVDIPSSAPGEKNATSYTAVGGLFNGTTYRFRIRAVNPAGHSQWSDETGPATPAATDKPIITISTKAGKTVRYRDPIIVDVRSNVPVRWKWSDQFSYLRASIENGGTLSFERRSDTHHRFRVGWFGGATELRIQIGAGAMLHKTRGTSSAASNTITVRFDDTAPAISRATVSYGPRSPASVTVEFTEPVFAAPGGFKWDCGGMTRTRKIDCDERRRKQVRLSPTTYKFTPKALLAVPDNFTWNFSLDLSSFRDEAGNLGTGTYRTTLKYDDGPPNPSFTGPTGQQHGDFVAIFRDPEANLDQVQIDDLSVTNGSVFRREKVSGSEGTLWFTIRPLYTGEVRVSLRAGAYADSSGNQSVAPPVVKVPVKLANSEPSFPSDSVTSSWNETGKANTHVATVLAAADRDYVTSDTGGRVPRDPLTYALAPNYTDHDLFTFDPATRQLTLKPALDYETAPVRDGKREYRVYVTVRDDKKNDGTRDTSGEADDTMRVVIPIHNVDEPGRALMSPGPQVGESVEATLTDPDGIVGEVSWQWMRTYWGLRTHPIAGATSDTYTVERAWQGWYLEAWATYTDGHGANKRARATRDTNGRGSERVRPPRPAAPSRVKAVPGDRSVALSWDNPGNADITGWEYRHKEAAATAWGAWTAIAGSSASTTRATVSGLVNGTRYAFQVRAQSTRLGTGDPSEPVEAKALPADQVRGVTIVPQLERLSVSWERVAGASGYKVQWKSGDEAFGGAGREHTLSGAGATRYTIPRLRGLVSYTVQVIATKAGAADGMASEPATGQPLAPALSIDAPRADEGDSGTTDLTWTVRLQPASAHEVRVTYADAGTGTATADTDYADTTGTLTFAAGDTVRTFTVQVSGDTAPEPDETVVMRLSGAVNATIATADGAGTIADDDEHPPARTAGLTATATGGGTVVLRWTGPADSTVTKWQVRRDEGLWIRPVGNVYERRPVTGAWTDVPGSGPATRSHSVTGLAEGVAYRFQVRAVNAVGPGAAGTEAATISRSPVGKTVRADSGIVPVENGEALAAGSRFRLVFLTSTNHRATSPHIRDYNRFVQAAAARNPAFSSFAGEFRALVSSATVDARDNAALTGTGVPLYWLGGKKIADNYAGFHGTPASREGRDESGSVVAGTRIYRTGSNADGTRLVTPAGGFYLGSPNPVDTTLTGRVGSSLVHGNSIGSPRSSNVALLGVSPVLEVGQSARQLASPRNVRVAAGHGQLVVMWDAVTGADEYKVQWKSGSEGYGSERQASGVGVTTWTIPGLAAGTAYTVRVFAAATGYPDSAPSAEATGTPKEPAPARVANVRAAPGVGELVVTWDAVAGAGGYKVQWKSGSESYAAARERTVAGGTTTRDVIPGLTPGTAYTVRVVATRAGVPDGQPSAEATATPEALGRVAGVRLEPGAGRFVVTWDAVAGAGGYKVQWKSGSESYAAARERTVAGGATTRDVIPDLTPGTAYTVRVVATKAGVADGPPSAEATGTLPALTAIPPKLTISGVPAKITSTAALTVTFTFDEAVTGFAAADVTVTRATLTGFTEATAGTVWTATVTPDGYGDVVLSVAAGAATDSDGNRGPVAKVTRTAAYDATAPTLVIAGVPPSIDGPRALTVTFTFDEAVTGFAADDVTVENGKLAGLAPDAAKRVWTATLTPDGRGDLKVTVAKGSVADGHGNRGPPAAVARSARWRPTPPTATIEGMPPTIKVGRTDQVCATIVFSEPVEGFSHFAYSVRAAEPGVANVVGQSPDTTRPANTAWRICASGISSDYTLTLKADSVTDRDGNRGPPAAVSATAVYDADAPALAIAGVPPRINNTLALPVTFTFDEAVSGFTAADVKVANGRLSGFTANAGGKVWTATVTPDGAGDLEVTVARNTVTDGGGTMGPAAAVSAIATYDATPPELAIGAVPSWRSKLTSTDPLTVTFTFDEPVTGFTAADLEAVNATLSGLVETAAGTVWSATLSPDGMGDVTVRVRAAAAVDRHGNRGPAALVRRTASLDATPPGLTIDLPPKIGAATKRVTATFVFDELVRRFAAGDIAVTNGTAGPVRFADTNQEVKNDDAGTRFVTRIEPDGGGDLAVTVAPDSVEDLFGHTGPSAPVRARSEYDDTVPEATVEGIPAKINSTAALTAIFKFNEAVTGFAESDVTVTNGTLTGFTEATAGTKWTATVTPDGSGDLTVTVARNAAVDTYGNVGPAKAASATATWDDGTAPEVTVAGLPESFTFPAEVEVTFTFDEAVSGFAAADVTVENGALSGFENDATKTPDTVWTATVTPDGKGDLTVTVGADTVADRHGNTGPQADAAATATYRAPAYGLRLRPDVRSLGVLWDPIAGATGYRVQWKSGMQSFNTGDRQHTIADTATGYALTGLTAGTSYTVRVTATRTGAPDAAPSREVAAAPVANVVPAFLEGTAVRREVAEDASAGDAVGGAVSAVDSAGDTLTYTLSGTGHDNFAIDGSGQITVAADAALDHETTPSYALTAAVHDGKDAAGEVEATPAVDATIAVTIAVTNVDEAGSVAFDSETPAVGTALTARVEDPDGDVSSITWQWAKSSTKGGPTPTSRGRPRQRTRRRRATRGRGCGRRRATPTRRARARARPPWRQRRWRRPRPPPLPAASGRPP